MALTIRTPTAGSGLGALDDVKYDYDYPGGLDFRPESELHRKIVGKVMEYAQDSYSSMERRHKSWNEIDESLTAYVPVTEKEEQIAYEDSRKPITVIIPQSFATLEVFLTYCMAAFLQDPIFRYEGFSPEDELGAIMLEKVVELHCIRSKVALALHTFFRDAVVYNLGAVAPFWDTKWGFRSRAVTLDQMDFFGAQINQMNPAKARIREEAIVFEGNALEPIDPYKYLPDPNVAINETQKGEFVGYVSREILSNLLSLERNDPETFFNVKYLKHVDGRSAIYGGDKSHREERIGQWSTEHSMVTRPVDLVNMYINLIPKDWKLGSKDYPEKWFFSIAGDKLLIEARPINLDHDMYPICTASPDSDGHSCSAVSRLEMIYPLQKAIDWFITSHVTNVRKAINDMLIVDPALINVKDLSDPKPGKIIRLRRSAWGRGVGDAVQQLKVMDITQHHVQDAAFMIDMLERGGGAVQNLQGVMRPGSERRSATEARGTQTSAMSRMEHFARMISLQGMHDIAIMFAEHTQQFMSQEVYVKTAGDWQSTLASVYGPNVRKMKVTPFDLLISYDVVPRDGSVPGGNYSDFWGQVFTSIAQNPWLAQTFDIVRIFKHMAVSAGAKNVNDFVRDGGGQINAQVMPDEQVAQQAQAGNIIPFPGA